MTKLTFEATAITIENPPQDTSDMTVRIELDVTLTPPSNVFTLTKKGLDLATTYEVHVPDTKALGLAWDEGTADEIANDLVRALNLTADRAVFARRPPQKATTTFQRVPPPPPPPSIVRQGNHVSATFHSQVHASVTAMAVAKSADAVDPSKVLGHFARLRKARAGFTPNASLAKAFDALDIAAASWDRYEQIANYARAAELATNHTRPKSQHLDGKALDKHLASLAGMPEADAERVRFIANRSKHAHRTPQEQAELDQAMSTPAKRVRDARALARAAILSTI